MFDKQAITALQEGASIGAAAQSVMNAIQCREPAALPSDFKLHDLETFMPMRRRQRGTMKTTDLDSFVAYVNASVSQRAVVFVDAENLSATSVLNMGTPDAPGHADNLAVFAQPATAAYMALSKIASGQPVVQRDLAEFLEDWAPMITTFDSEGEISLPSGIAAIRAITIETARKVEQTEQSLSASRSAFESVTATSRDRIPTLVYFQCQPFAALESRLFVGRLGILTGDEKAIRLTLRIQRIEQHRQEMAQELVEKINYKFYGRFDSVSVNVGAYIRGQ